MGNRNELNPTKIERKLKKKFFFFDFEKGFFLNSKNI